jgi:hypothetical protein
MQEMESNAMIMSNGLIAVIVCFGVAFVAVVFAILLWWLRRRRRRSSDDAGHSSTKVHMTVDHHRNTAPTSMTGGTDSADRTSSGDDIHPDDHDDDNDEFYQHHQSPPRLVRNEIWIDPHHDIDDISTLEGGTVPPPHYFDGAVVATAFVEDRPTTAASSNPAVVLTSWSDWGRNHNRVVETTVPQRWMDPNNDVDDDADIITLDVPTVPREYGDVGTDEPTASVNFEFENTRRHLYHHSTDNQEDRTHSYRTGLSSNPTVMTSWSKLGMSAAELDFAEDTSFEEQFR